jgi:ribosomal protein L37AE/L43A
MDAPKYTCPECGSLILNRAYPKCEHCDAELPAELLFSKAETDKVWTGIMAQHQIENDQQFRDSLASHLHGGGPLV